jgi:hypothetical protein
VDPDGGGIGDIGYWGVNWLGLDGTGTFGQLALSRAINTAAGALVGGVVNSFANGWNWHNFGDGALWGGIGGLAATYVPWETVLSGFGKLGKWTFNWFQSDNYWILYDGLQVLTYRGKYGDSNKSNKIKEYAGTSGGEGYQNSDYQSMPELGPVPEGDYSLNLRPDFTRKAQTAEDGQTSADIGVDLLPWGNGVFYSGWGQWRARLEKIKVNSSRDNFYFHDSYKGYSHGCIETNTELYYDLSRYKRAGQKNIKVKVKYKGPGASTNGGTKQVPPPWWDGKKPYMDKKGNLWYSPRPGAFPDPTKM